MLAGNFSSRQWLMRIVPVILGVLLTLNLASVRSWAQSTQGVILGSIKDPAGAVIPGAAITLKNMDEGASRTTTSNAVGGYRFLDVKAARYTVEVVAPGFKRWLTSDIVLQVRQELRLDATLAVGNIQQE